MTRHFVPPLADPDDGRLLPYGWRPDRDDRHGSHGDGWVVAGPAGQLRLGDGTVIALRPFRPGDGQLLVAGFDRLSDQSRYRRFLAPVPRLTQSMLTFLTSVDADHHRAWGAVVGEPDGPVGAGVARWVRSTDDPAVAEMAVTVIDDYQGRGLGGLLRDVAVLDAAAHGVERFSGVVLGENVASRRMLARGGARLRPDGGGVFAYDLELAPQVDRLRGTALPLVVSSSDRRANLPA